MPSSPQSVFRKRIMLLLCIALLVTTGFAGRVQFDDYNPGSDLLSERCLESGSKDCETHTALTTIGFKMADLFRRLLPASSSSLTLEATDNRNAINNSTVFPYNTIGLIRTWWDDGPHSCTGVLISSRHVLTAAHCVVKPGMELTGATFTPGYNTAQRNSNPQGTANVVRFHVYPESYTCVEENYTDCHMNNDFAILELKGMDRPYKNWMRYGREEAVTSTMMINTAGYPGDVTDCFNANGRKKCQPYRLGCREWEDRRQSTATLDCYTFKGQSGSPVWLYDTINKSRVICGVLVGEAKNIGRFVFITGRVFNWLQFYVRQARA